MRLGLVGAMRRAQLSPPPPPPPPVNQILFDAVDIDSLVDMCLCDSMRDVCGLFDPLDDEESAEETWVEEGTPPPALGTRYARAPSTNPCGTNQPGRARHSPCSPPPGPQHRGRKRCHRKPRLHQGPGDQPTAAAAV